MNEEITHNYDLILKNGMVIDGKGTEPVKMDVAVRGESIAAIGFLEMDEATRTIESRGKWSARDSLMFIRMMIMRF